MSNHAIGESLSPILREIMEFHEKGELSANMAETLIQDLLGVVCGEDGNEYEATFVVDRLYCAHCGKRVPDGEYMFSPGDSLNYLARSYQDKLLDEYNRFGLNVCKDCFDEFLSRHPKLKDVNPEKERQRQIEDGETTIAGEVV